MNSYLLAVTPPQNIIEKVDEYKNKYRKHTYSISPHITILPPFYIDGSLEDFEIKLSVILKDTVPEKIKIDSIDYFENGNDTNVIYFKPNGESIQYLRKIFSTCFSTLKDEIKNKYEDYPRDYNPHLTISSKVSDIDFLKIKKELINVKEVFEFKIKSIDIYTQQEDSGVWEKIKEFYL